MAVGFAAAYQREQWQIAARSSSYGRVVVLRAVPGTGARFGGWGGGYCGGPVARCEVEARGVTVTAFFRRG